MIVAALSSFLLLFFVTLAGRMRSGRSNDSMESAFLQLLGGLGLASLFLFLLVFTGQFRWPWIAASLLLVAALQVRINRLPSRKEIVRAAAWSGLATALATTLYLTTPPYEALIAGDDASIYTATAEQLARTGKISYQDSLVTQMTSGQRESFFRNRFREDWTGPYIRFAGGVRLSDPSTGLIRFAFYHLTPAWLALSILIFGQKLFLIWISLLAALILITLFLLGKRMGGWTTATLFPVLMFVIYPVQYFLRFPLSEPLAMLLFCGGLLSFLENLDDRESPAASLVRTGLLWGSSFLSRVDCIYLVFLLMLLGFTCVPHMARRWRHWIPLLRTLAVFALLAASYQFAAGEYVTIFTNSENLRSSVFTDLVLETVTLLTAFIRDHPFASACLLVIAVAIVIFIPIKRQMESSSRTILVPAVVGVLLALLLLLPITGFPPPPMAVVLLQLSWFYPYIPPVLLALFMCGTAVLLYFHGKQPAVQILSLLLVLSCALYLIRPLIFPEQPWAMRRFITAVIPVFLLLSTAGWSRGLSALAKRAWVGASLALILGLIAAYILLMRSNYLFTQPILQNILQQVDSLAARIPKGGLVLIPDRRAGLHLELPLQYRHGIDTLLLPLDYTSGRRLNQDVQDFLSDQKDKRPVIILSLDETHDIYPLWRYFGVRKIGEAGFQYSIVPRYPQDSYPAEVLHPGFQASLYSLHDPARGPVRSSIHYNDPEITFLNFNQAEGGFRWTRNYSVLTDFVFHTHGKETLLTIEPGPLPPWFDRRAPDMEVVVNYRIPCEFVRVFEERITFRLPAGVADEIRSVSLRTPTFRERPDPKDPGRELGLSFSKLRIDSGTTEN